MVKEENNQHCKTDIKNRCFSIINIIAPGTEMNEKIEGWLDGLDFIEIIMKVEIEFDCTIKECETNIDGFEKISDLVDWLVKNITKTNN